MKDAAQVRRKLIEVALPLEAINRESAREKSIRHGHPSTLHLWWARRPLATARAIIFAQMVDDPSSLPQLFPTDKKQEKERQRLFKIVEELVRWENTTNDELLGRARSEIFESWRRACAANADHPRAAELFDPHQLPVFHDPFAGGGALPLEAQRLGLESFASDLNPVAVLINKAMIELPPLFAGKAPVNAGTCTERTLLARKWNGVQGLADDVRFYGKWMRDEAERRVGASYPQVEVTAELATGRADLKPLVGRKLNVIAWLWARTVKSPNPAFARVHVPLAATFMLGTKPGKEVHIEPVTTSEGYDFVVRIGKPEDAEAAKRGTKHSRGANFQCVMSGAVITADYIKEEAMAGRMESRLMAIVAEGERGRIYLSPIAEHEAIAREAKPEWKPEVEFLQQALGFRVGNYGMALWSDVFTNRQLKTLTAFADLVLEARELVIRDAAESGMGRTEALTYADAVATYLGLAVGRVSDYCSTVCTWANNPQMEIVRGTFARQALPMTWDYAEANPFGPSTGSLEILLGWIGKVIERLPANRRGLAFQDDAARGTYAPNAAVLSTDPPYFDNIGYADLSDFFYVWLRRALRPVYPDLFATVAVPKAEELVATPARHGGRGKAESFFMRGMTDVMHRLAVRAHPEFPISIYYAFKQSESDDEKGTASTGWDTFLEAVIRSGFAINGTWPVRTERGGRSRDIGSSALASSIVLVCRPRPENAPTATRREFVSALKKDLPLALGRLQRSNIAPVDLPQAAIGPGMAIFSRHAKILEPSGTPMTVRTALQLINEALDEYFTSQEGDFDPYTRFGLTWYEQHRWENGPFGDAENLAKARNISVSGVADAGFLLAKAGKVRLLKRAELPKDWDPLHDTNATIWEATQHLIKRLETDGGEKSAADLLARLGPRAQPARDLAYRLYTLCERKKWADDALAYNTLVVAWPDLQRLAEERPEPTQERLL